MKDYDIFIRLSEDENIKLCNYAKQKNISESEFVRRKIEEGIAEDDEIDEALSVLVDAMKIEGDRINRSAVDANTNGVNNTHTETAKSVMRNQIALLKEFEEHYLKLDEEDKKKTF